MASNKTRAKRKGLTEAIRRRIDRDATCLRCGRLARGGIEIHHLLPVYRGGTDELSNLVPLCHRCHKNAPNNFIDFVHWLRHPFPPPYDSLVVGFGMGFEAALSFLRDHPDHLAEGSVAWRDELVKDLEVLHKVLEFLFETQMSFAEERQATEKRPRGR